MRYEEVNPGEWQVDPKTGERFRMVGHIKEYEMMIHTSGGIVPASQLEDFHKRQKEAEERRKAAAAAAGSGGGGGSDILGSLHSALNFKRVYSDFGQLTCSLNKR